MSKFIFFLAWLGIFLLSIVGIVYVVYPSYLLTFNLTPFAIKAIILNTSILYILISFLKLKSKFKKKGDYALHTADGKVFLTEPAIASLAKEAVSYDSDITVKKITSTNNKGLAKLFLLVESSSDLNLSEKVSRLQSVIKTYFKEKAGVELDSVEVKIVKLLEKRS